MGHYDSCYEADEIRARVNISKNKHYKEWSAWKKKFLKTKLSELTVQDLINGLERLEEYDVDIEIDDKNEP